MVKYLNPKANARLISTLLIMEALPAHDSCTSMLWSHGIKRGASSLEPPDAKRARCYDNESDSGMFENPLLILD